jgi:hypothetical protein
MAAAAAARRSSPFARPSVQRGRGAFGSFSRWKFVCFSPPPPSAASCLPCWQLAPRARGQAPALPSRGPTRPTLGGPPRGANNEVQQARELTTSTSKAGHYRQTATGRNLKQK